MLTAITVITVVAVGLRGEERAEPPRSADSTAASPTPSPSPTLLEGAVEAAAPTRVEVPAIDLAVDVLPVTPKGGALDPPTLDEAYWIEAYGVPATAADNTVYLTGHSYDRGEAAFNPLFDKDTQVARVTPGDEVVVTTEHGTLTYAVRSAERYPKDELAQTDEVWRIVPGRLVLITCFQRNDGGDSQDNLVVYAELVRSVPVGADSAE